MALAASQPGSPPSAFSFVRVLVSPALVLAPMAGLTDATFRRVVRECGGVGLVVSELISSEALSRGASKAGTLTYTDAGEHPIALQIAGADPVRMAEAAKMCVGFGADIVDINMGCPAPKVTRGGAGAALLRNPMVAARIAGAVVRSVEVPVTAKLRTGWSEHERTFIEVARLLVEEGVRGLTLHGRSRSQGYSGKTDWTSIALLKSSVSIPVVGNGDVTTPEEALTLWNKSGCDGIMVGRAALKNPWIFKQAEELRRTGAFHTSTREERVALVRKHFERLLAEQLPAQALYRMKSFLGKYTAGMPGAVALRRGLGGYRTPGDLLEAFKDWAGAGTTDASSPNG